MTVSEMHTRFKVGVDKAGGLNYPRFESEEIDLFLNKAQERFIKLRYGKNNIKRMGFEQTQKRMDDLREVIQNAAIVPAASAADNKPNGVFATLPSDYWFSIQEEVSYTATDCNGVSRKRREGVKSIRHNDYQEIIQDPFNKPDSDTILRLPYQNFHELITDGDATVTTYHLRYIKKPVDIDLATATDCELADHTHEEIVNEAIQIALENIEQPRINTFVNELNRTE